MEYNKGLRMTRKISVVTTFNRRGLSEYAQKMIDSYMENCQQKSSCGYIQKSAIQD